MKLREPAILAARLKRRTEQGLLRKLVNKAHLTDLCSNDYLGFARSPILRDKILKAQQELEPFSGSSGSRLISGEHTLFHQIEEQCAKHFRSPSALIFSSGYDANVGIFSALAHRGDTVIYDELIHASVHDGVRLSFAERESFRHNDLEDLRKKLRAGRGTRYVAVESVYSMDGDYAPLKELCELCEAEDAYLIVDEAHSAGVYGPLGAGRVVELGLESKVFLRLVTFSKAFGVHGAVVLSTPTTTDALVNFCRPFIFSTAISPLSLLSIRESLDLSTESNSEREMLFLLISYFQKLISSVSSHEVNFLQSHSPIQAVIVPDNTRAKELAVKLEDLGLYVKAILSPTVPKGKERLRISLHAFNSTNEVERCCIGIKNYLEGDVCTQIEDFSSVA